MGWQTIESAPKDGTSILTYRVGKKQLLIAWFFNGGWHCDACYHSAPMEYPTHWMPLPDFP